KFVLEYFAQQDNSTLERLQLLNKDEKSQRNGLLGLHALFWIDRLGDLGSENRLRQPGAYVYLALSPRQMKLVNAQTCKDCREISLQRANTLRRRSLVAHVCLLYHVLGVHRAAEYAVRDGKKVLAV